MKGAAETNSALSRSESNVSRCYDFLKSRETKSEGSQSTHFSKYGKGNVEDPNFSEFFGMFKNQLVKWSKSKAYKNEQTQVEIGRYHLYKELVKQNQLKSFDEDLGASYHDQEFDFNEIYGETGDFQSLSS